MNFIELLIVDQHEEYVGRKAILHERDRSLFVTIYKTSKHAATIRHGDGQLQKVFWNRLSIEQ